jgi:hypothetical protein
MSTYKDPRLTARFSAVAPEPLPGDWEDVLGRTGRARTNGRRLADPLARRHRRRVLVLALAVLVVVVGAASALAVRAILDHGIVGLAPEGAAPSTPTKGELVLRFGFGRTMGDPGGFRLEMYADGRMIWMRNGDYSRTDEYRYGTGWLERRLTPEGIELVMAEVRSSGMVDHNLVLHGNGVEGLYTGLIDFRSPDRRVVVAWGDGITLWDVGPDVPRQTPTPEQARALVRLDERLENPASWLPASAWEDPQIRAFVPSAYSVCFQGQRGLGLSRVLALLPERAEDMLRAQELVPNSSTNHIGTFVAWCARLRNEEARALERILDEAGVRGHESEFGLEYGAFDPAYFSAEDFGIGFWPILPDQM